MDCRDCIYFEEKFKEEGANLLTCKAEIPKDLKFYVQVHLGFEMLDIACMICNRFTPKSITQLIKEMIKEQNS